MSKLKCAFVGVSGAQERDKVLYRVSSANRVDRNRLLANDMGAAVQSGHHADRSRRERGGEVYGVHPALGGDRLSSALR